MRSANLVGGREEWGGTTVAGRYLVERALGAGAEGQIFLARDQISGALRVLKCLRQRDEGTWRRVRAQFVQLGDLSHPHIVATRDLLQHEKAWVLVMDFVEGAPLRTMTPLRLVANGKPRFASWAWQLAETLAYLHERRLVHGDLSPDNVLVADGNRHETSSPLTLIDFAWPEANGLAQGTLGFAAPEALAGQAGPSSDLFSLGAVLAFLWTGVPPFGIGAEAGAAVLRGAEASLPGVTAELGEGWGQVLSALLSTDERRRPGSARSLLARLRPLLGASALLSDLRAPPPGGDPLAGVFVGREDQRRQLVGLFTDLVSGRPGPAVVALTGVEGSGRRRLLQVGLRDFALWRAREETLHEVLVFEGSAYELGKWLLPQGTDGLSEARDADGEIAWRLAHHARLAEGLEARARERPLLVVLGDEPESHAFARFVGGAAREVPLLIVVLGEQPFESPHAVCTSVGPLSLAEVDQVLEVVGGLPDEDRKEGAVRVWRRCSGHAASVASLLRSFLLACAEGRALSEAWEEALAHFEGAPSASPETERVSVALIRRLSWHLLAPQDAGQGEGGGGDDTQDAEARARGWLSADDPPRLSPYAHRMVLRLSLADEGLRAHVRALASRSDAEPRAAAQVLSALGEGAAARERLRRAIDQVELESVPGVQAARAPGTRTTRIGLLEGLASLNPTALRTDEAVALASSQALSGEHQKALETLAGAETSTTEASSRWELAERRAWVLGRSGRPAEALAETERALTSTAAEPFSSSSPAYGRLRSRRVRLLLSLGRWAEIFDAVSPADEDPVALEALFLARAYRGDFVLASALRPLLPKRGLPSARLAFLEGLLAQLQDDPRAAVAAYGVARLEARAARDFALAASATLNEGLAAGDLGDYITAGDRLEQAVRDLGRLGARDELAAALFNAGILHVEIGREGPAGRALAALRAHLADGETRAFRDFEPLLASRLARLGGDWSRALHLLQGISAAFGAGGQLAQESRRQSTELRALLGLPPEGPLAALDPAAAAASEDRLAAGFAVLHSASSSNELVVQWAESLGEQAVADVARGRWPRALRAGCRAARLAARAGRSERQKVFLTTARRAYEEIQRRLPEEARGELMRDQELAWLSTEATEVSGETIARLSRLEGQLRRLLRINKRLNGETRLPKLLELVIDTVIELTDAERGLLLLEDEAGVLQVRVARNIDQQTLAGEALSFSRSIAQRVAAAGKALVTLDASGDPRFREAVSVSDLHLRSVLAVPLSVKGRVVGTIYVDHRVRRGVFRDEDVALVSDFAEQAALALENARLLQELRRREHEVEGLNRKLATELEARKEELCGLQVELRENREALSLRYDYGSIVGRTPAMLEVFRLLDRLTDTRLPVVIQGESGTGKELVARALHFNGPRRAQPFVGENCAALPETLLESTLFGYVRGAFTGADHDRRGLFEVADGGTLFLDEVGEMSPALQGKLLRVLQEGEFRRVGSEKVRKVDVRIVAATNRDLSRMVQESRFRQDLFYRLSVARISLPPLRDRREDIPAMVRHLLEKHRGDQAPKLIDTSALVALAAYHWPGNVRELENEILRASAFASDRIGVGDLSPHIVSSLRHRDDSTSAPVDELELRPRVEALERALIQQALERHGGNQTRAADVLGLSRFGLQKKLQRYGISVKEHQS